MIQWNIPNALTLLRFALIPVFLVVYLTANTPAAFYGAAGIVLLSGITDILDGVIARRYHMETEWGRAYDPIADKATQIAVAFALWRTYPGLWFCVLFFVVKEGLMVFGGIRLYKRFHQVWGARWFGKLATVVFYLVALVIIGLGTHMPESYIIWLMLGVVSIMFFSGVMYVSCYLSIIKQAKNRTGGHNKDGNKEK